MSLRDRHAETGAVFGRRDGVEVVRHYGDPVHEYRSAAESAAVFDRSHRGRFLVAGRSPRQMLKGTLTGSLPAPLAAAERAEGAPLGTGRAARSAALTPKGKAVAELRVIPWWEGGEDEAFLLDVPAAGTEGLREHFRTYLPPRFATVERLEDTAMVTVAGPEAAEALARALDGLGGALGALPEGALERAGAEGGSAPRSATDAGPVLCLGDEPRGALRLVRTDEVSPAGGPAAWDVIGPPSRVEAVWAALLEAGVKPAGSGVWETLRIEAGRPLFGADLDDSTIPVEAGIHDRVIDHAKGCYTGQEVIVRIRDRGRVNRHLRGLLLGQEKAPSPGTELFDGEGKAVGRVTSSAESPRYGQAVALGYVRREVEPGGEVRVGGPDGPAAEVRALGRDWGR